MVIYIVLQIIGNYRTRSGDIGGIPEFQGAFEKEDDARAACIKPNYGYFPVRLGESVPDECVGPIPGLTFPIQATQADCDAIPMFEVRE